MELITNFDEAQNHFARLNLFAGGADELTVVSPYLSRDMLRLLTKLSLSQMNRFRLVTTLEPNDNSQLYTVDSLRTLAEYFESVRPDVEWRVDIANDLHGKLYLFGQRGSLFAAIISSANFTENGLRHNREWGVLTRDNGLLKQLGDSLARLDVHELNVSDIGRLVEECERYRLAHPTPEVESVGLNLNRLLEAPEKSKSSSTTVWLKPEGTAEEPIVEGHSYATTEMNLHFPKVKPSGVKVGDLMIAYGVGVRRILSVFEVTGSVTRATDEEMLVAPWKERWPWYVPARNTTPRFGQAWWKYNLYLSELTSAYQRGDPKAPLTAAGGNTLGALNYGAGKVRLDSAFARSILDAVDRAMAL